MQKLSERKHNLLIGAISKYVEDASIITSGGVKTQFALTESSATLRNELSTLEAMGYLHQPHTSAGRIPTAYGYQYYVQSLLGNVQINRDDLARVKEILDKRTSSVAEIVSELAAFISSVTNCPTVVMMKKHQKLVVESIQVIPLVDGQVLFLIQTSSGYITNYDFNIKADPKDFEDASRILTNHFKGKTIEYMTKNIKDVESDIKGEISLFKQITEHLLAILEKEFDKEIMKIKNKGTGGFLENKQIESVTNAQKLLTLLDDESKLGELISIKEGEDNVVLMPVEQDISIMKTSIQLGGETVGSVGVIGPNRMDYIKIASALKLICEWSKDGGNTV